MPVLSGIRFTQPETSEQLPDNVRQATALHFEESDSQPALILLHYVRDELIPLEAA